MTNINFVLVFGKGKNTTDSAVQTINFHLHTVSLSVYIIKAELTVLVCYWRSYSVLVQANSNLIVIIAET